MLTEEQAISDAGTSPLQDMTMDRHSGYSLQTQTRPSLPSFQTLPLLQGLRWTLADAQTEAMGRAFAFTCVSGEGEASYHTKRTLVRPTTIMMMQLINWKHVCLSA